MKILMNWAPAELCTVGTYAGSDAVRQECFALISATKFRFRIAASNVQTRYSLNDCAQERSMSNAKIEIRGFR